MIFKPEVNHKRWDILALYWKYKLVGTYGPFIPSPVEAFFGWPSSHYIGFWPNILMVIVPDICFVIVIIFLLIYNNNKFDKNVTQDRERHIHSPILIKNNYNYFNYIHCIICLENLKTCNIDNSKTKLKKVGNFA